MKINNPINIQYDPEADALYIKFKKGVIFETKRDGLELVDYDKKGNVLGLEILNCSGKKFSIPNSKKEGIVLARPA